VERLRTPTINVSYSNCSMNVYLLHTAVRRDTLKVAWCSGCRLQDRSSVSVQQACQRAELSGTLVRTVPEHFRNAHQSMSLVSQQPCRRQGGEEYSSYSFLTSHCMGWVVSVTPRQRFTLRERTSGTHWTGGWVGLRAGMDIDVRCWGSNLRRPICSQTLHWLSHRSMWEM
jgi:hypothetical protein